ncbi:MAG: divergent polysaccharide deacetylase family protein [Deltaproteobacteria bacterium]|nr:divergent polysaccharide deacetylase family protein [Deltaproteobacteria bacterium]
MQDGTNYWNFTELQIKEEDLKAVNRLKDILAHNLAEFKPVVTFHMEDVSDKEIVFNIFISELHTHRICMIYYNGDVKETMSPCPKIAIIIDDLGYDKKIAEAFIDIDLPLNLSVLPYAPFTEHVIKLAAKRGREILLHLPLEPKDYPSLNPGPGTLLRNMGDDEIREKLDGIFRQTPGISGVNHHMGSHFTESSDKMSVVMSEIKKRGLFYVDSRTTALTVGYDIAKKIGVPAAKKSLFFDHDVTTMAIKYQMERLLSIARYSGSAVGIGHPHPETLEILSQYEDKLKQEYRVVPVSSLVN